MKNTIREYFNSESRIHAHGTIAPWGCFRFNGKVSPRYSFSPFNVRVYLVGFHLDLIEYAKQGCTLMNDEGYVAVIKRGRVVVRLRPSEITLVNDESSERVSKSGHLWYVTISGYERRLVMAAKGEDPGVYDNSPFYKVARRFAGQKVILLRIGEKAKTFLPNGTPIWCKVYFPLSYKRWGRRLPRHCLSRRISSGLLGED